MTPDQFELLARRLERRAQAHPTLYRVQLAFLAALGYAYMVLLLLAALGLAGALVVAVFVSHARWFALKSIEFVVVLLVFTWVIIRALVVRIPPPKGVFLERPQVPRLSALVEDLRASAAAPPVHRIVVTDSFNASLATIPLWGYLGPTRNYLLLGLPLMQALSPSHFKSVVAHELGHLSNRHGRFTSWVYRVRQTWSRLQEDLLSRDSHGQFWIEVFLEWYAPRFNAWSLVLARFQEYEADRFAVEATSPQIAGEALITIALREHVQDEEYWPKLLSTAKVEASPPEHAIRSLGMALRESVPEIPGERWLEAALKEPTVPTDTHPALSDRLRAMRFALPEKASAYSFPAALHETAADALLGELAPEITARLDGLWCERMRQHWSRQHKEAGKARRRLRQLEEKARSGSLVREEIVERALLAANYGERERAIELLQTGLAEFPQDAMLHRALGHLMLEAGDAAGVERLETAMHFDPAAVEPVCHRIYAWFRERNDAASCGRWRERARVLQVEADRAIAERTELQPDDRFLPHDLDPERVQHVRTLIGGVRLVKAVYLARKEVQSYTHKPLFVLGVVIPLEIGPNVLNRLLTELARCELPGDLFPIFSPDTTQGLPAGLLQIPDAAILTRDAPSPMYD